MDIVEDEFPIIKKPIMIYESMLQQENPIMELDKDISITHPGINDNEMISNIKNLLIQSESNKNINFSLILNQKEENDNDSNDENEEKKSNNIFSIKYKDIYIGGISPNFQMREGFGFNRYDESHSFYIGQWKKNMKEGMGFLKIDENNYYFGNFHNNQFDGEGILYIKSENKNLLYIGNMSNGAFDEGVYIDIDKNLFYRGKFINGKKSDDFCTMIEMNNNQIFVGKVEDDIFERGYLCIYNSEQIQIPDENGQSVLGTKFDLDKIFYFFKDNDDNYQFIHNFKNVDILIENIKKVFAVEQETKKQIDGIKDYFNYLNAFECDEDFNSLKRYNDKDDDSLFYILKNNSDYYLNAYKEIKENYDINEIKNEIDISNEIFASQNQ